MSGAEAVGRVLAAPPVRQFLGFAERCGTWPENRLVALTYHRIDRPAADGRVPGLVSATPDEFAAQMEIVADRFHPVSIDDVLSALDGGSELPGRAVLLTFDDAVDDFFHHAWPVLRRLALPSVVFVPTALAGRAGSWFWWDAVHAALTRTARREPYRSAAGIVSLRTPEERAAAFRTVRDHAKRIPYRSVGPMIERICDDLGVEPPPARVMDWPMLQELANGGVGVCAHTRTHPHLDQLPLEEAEEEVSGSVDDLRDRLGHTPAAFAYPSGQLTPEVADVVAAAGIRAAFTTRRGSNRLGTCDPMTMRRINVSRRTGLGAARLQMHPWADRAGALRRAS
jgi:peptidoglycan/xylan/chitin deacetylase (PgdA/CDA1 family)